MNKRLIGTFFIALLFPVLSFACDLCGCFVPNDTVRQGFQVGVTEQYSWMTDLSLEGEILNNAENQYLKSSYTVLFANYHFNERLAIQLNTPFIYRSFQRMENGSLAQGTESGVGDILLVGYYVPFQRKNPFSQFNWKLVTGLKFPTGNSDPLAEGMDEGEQDPNMEMEQASAIQGMDIALGSGSWDLLLGTNIFGRVNRWFYSGQLQYALRTRGAFDYRYANDFLWYGGPGYYISSNPDYTVGLQALLNGEYKGEDEMGTEKMENTAITSVYAGPTAMIGIKQLGMAEIGLAFPVIVNNSGLQTVPKYRLRMGLTWRIP